MPLAQRAFTLIEVMVSLAIGLMIMYAAMTGIRVAAQSISIANRLSIENNMLQAGMIMALEEVDTWREYDDPESENAEDRRLREEVDITIKKTGNTLRFGLPFSPMPLCAGSAGAQSSTGMLGAGNKYADGDVGWDPHYAWPPNDPRTWWRANIAENGMHRRYFGDYSRFSDSEYTSPLAYVWLNRQMQMIQKSLGFYGYNDYLPSSLPATFMREGRLAVEFFIGQPNIVPGFVDIKQTGWYHGGDDHFPLDRNENTGGNVMPMPPINNKATLENLVKKFAREKYGIGKGGHVNEKAFEEIEGHTLVKIPTMDQSPESWPTVKVEMARYLLNNRFVALSTVRCFNPLNGREIKLSFPAIGTTLRGARNMRKPGLASQTNGWAHWYGPHDSRNDPTIDNPVNIQ